MRQEGGYFIHHALMLGGFWIGDDGRFFRRVVGFSAVNSRFWGLYLLSLITTPASSHALIRAAFEDDEMPSLVRRI